MEGCSRKEEKEVKHRGVLLWLLVRYFFKEYTKQLPPKKIEERKEKKREKGCVGFRVFD